MKYIKTLRIFLEGFFAIVTFFCIMKWIYFFVDYMTMNTPKNEPSSLMKKLRNATAVGALALATTFTSCDKKAPQNNSKEYEILIDDESNTVK